MTFDYVLFLQFLSACFLTGLLIGYAWRAFFQFW